MPLTEELASQYNRWAPRPLITLTVGIEAKRYSTETFAVPAVEYGDAEYGDAEYGD